MSESRMRCDLVKLLRPLDAQAIETHTQPGVPDVEFIGGWIELKWRKSWPLKGNARVVLVHPITAQQRVWIKRRLRRGGMVWVMFRCSGDWLLLRGDMACRMLGEASRGELVMSAAGYWPRGEITALDLIAALKV